MPLAPEIKAFLEAGARAGLPQVWEAPLDVIRRNTQGRTVTSGPVEDVHEVINRFIPGPTADLPIRLYRPDNSSETRPSSIFMVAVGYLTFLISTMHPLRD